MSEWFHRNPLLAATDTWDNLTERQYEMAVEILEPTSRFDSDEIFRDSRFDGLMNEIIDLVNRTSSSCVELSERGRRARINLIWRDFLDKKRQPKRFPREK